jgi:hypothetical protein
MSDTSSPPAAVSEAERRQRLELEQAATDHLSRLNGALELQAAVLALLLPTGSQRAARAWRLETDATPNADAVREHVTRLSPAARLPWFEALVSRMRGQAPAARQALLESTRRVMGARGVVRPIDRLHWLAMRQRLGAASLAGGRNAAVTDLSRLPQSDVSAIAVYSAFLSRMVPLDAAPASQPADAAQTTAGVAWYDTVMAPWQRHATVEPCQPPDTDAVVHALQELQVLAWMQRPVLVRGWVGAARQHSPHGRLGDGAADALRLSCALLDSPLPPELARHYGAAGPQPPR